MLRSNAIPGFASQTVNYFGSVLKGAGFIGHAYFYRHPAVSADLILLLRDQLEPGSPGRPLHKRGENFWQITPDYPGVPDTPGR